MTQAWSCFMCYNQIPLKPSTLAVKQQHINAMATVVQLWVAAVPFCGFLEM